MLQDLTKIPESNLAYLAGIIDGEGCIRIAKRVKRSEEKWGYYELSLVVTNTDARLIKWIESTFGGSVTPLARRKSHHKDLYEWVVSSRAAGSILSAVEKFMIVKKEQAQLALRFRENINNTRTHPGQSLSPNVLEFRANCCEEMKRLKVS